MGVSYSVTSMKVKLRMASQRLAMLNNKKLNAIRMEQKVIAGLLNDNKDESARIKTEGIYHEKNLIMAQEILQLICDLLLQRLPLITAAKQTPPDDLEESIASLIFSTNYLDILEMKEISQMLAAKFGEPWAKRHLTNHSKKVNKKIVDLLEIKPPKFEKILELMKEIAAQFKIDWEPNLKDPEEEDSIEEGDNESKEHYKIGAVAPINSKSPASTTTTTTASSSSSSSSSSSAIPVIKKADTVSSIPAPLVVPPAAAIITPAAISSSSLLDSSLFPGTLNILIYSAKDLFNHAQSKSDVYIRVSSQTTGMSTAWKSSVAPFEQYGINPQWNAEHFPIPIKCAEDRILIEMHTVKPDVIIGFILLPIEQIINLIGQNWCQLIKDSVTQQTAGQLLISAQYLSLSSPNPAVPQLPPPTSFNSAAAANNSNNNNNNDSFASPSGSDYPPSSSSSYPPYNYNPPSSSIDPNDNKANDSHAINQTTPYPDAPPSNNNNNNNINPSDFPTPPAASASSSSSSSVGGDLDDLDELERRLRALKS